MRELIVDFLEQAAALAALALVVAAIAAFYFAVN